MPVIVIISLVLSLDNVIVNAVPGLAVVIVPEMVKGERPSSLLQVMNVASDNVANGIPLISMVLLKVPKFCVYVAVAVTSPIPVNVVVIVPIEIVCGVVVASAVLVRVVV